MGTIENSPVGINNGKPQIRIDQNATSKCKYKVTVYTPQACSVYAPPSEDDDHSGEADDHDDHSGEADDDSHEGSDDAGGDDSPSSSGGAMNVVYGLLAGVALAVLLVASFRNFGRRKVARGSEEPLIPLQVAQFDKL